MLHVQPRRRPLLTVGLFLWSVALPALGRAQTLRQVLRDEAVPLGPQAPADLDRPITSYAVEAASDLFVIAYYALGQDSHLPDTLRVSVFDRSRARWTHAALPRLRATAPAWDVGSVLEIHHTATHLYLDTHSNPSAGTVIVLTRALRPVAALDGWLLRLLPSGLAVYHRSMIHFAPTHSAEIWTFDARSGRDALLYPREPYDTVRRRYIDTAAALYARLGEAWFREHDQGMDPARFSSSLVGDIVTDGAGTAAALLMRFGERDDRTPAATPLLDVAVVCRGLRQADERCAETELSVLQARHPGWTPMQLLNDLLCPTSDPIAAPLRPETLTQGAFVAYTLFWQVAVPGGDSIVFRADGVVENARAGLAGRWRIADDSTLVIEQADRITGQVHATTFRLRGLKGDLVSPVPVAGRSYNPLFWIQRRPPPAPPCR